MTTKHEITRDDLMPMPEYGARRRDLKTEIRGIKKYRRLEVGPFAALYFGFLREKTGSIVAPAVLHGYVNLLVRMPQLLADS